MADPVVTTLATGSSATATTTVSFTAQPAGTLLELKVGSDDYRTTSGSNRPESTGWALATSGQDFLGAYVWYKIASGSETSVQYTIGSAAASSYELNAMTNIDTTNPLGAVSSLHTHGGANTGTTAITPTSGVRWIVTVFLAGMHSGSSSLGPAAALSNSYTIKSTVSGTGAPTEVGMSGYLVLDGGTATSTATVAPGWTLNAPQCSFGLLVAYKVVAAGGATLNGAAALSQSQTLAAGAVTTAVAAATMTQSATLSAAGTVARPATAALSQSSALTSAAVVTELGAAALSQNQTLTASAGAAAAGAAALSQPATLSAGVVVGKVGTANLSQAQTLAAAAIVSEIGAAALVQSQVLTASTTGSSVTGAASLAQTATLTSGATHAVPGAAALAQSTLLTSSAARIATGSVALAQSSTLTSAALVTVAASNALGQTQILIAGGTLTLQAAAALVAATVLIVGGAVHGSRPATPRPGLTLTVVTTALTLTGLPTGLTITTPATRLEVTP